MDHVPCKDENANAATSLGKISSWLCQAIVNSTCTLTKVSVWATQPKPKEFPDYAPSARALGRNYTTFLDKLGFKIEDKAVDDDPLHIRNAFIRNLKDHVTSSHYTYLRKADNEKSFEIMVQRFLLKHGSTYWGSWNRSHLAEENPLRGFLCPRDAERKGSRYCSRSPKVLTLKLNLITG